MFASFPLLYIEAHKPLQFAHIEFANIHYNLHTIDHIIYILIKTRFTFLASQRAKMRFPVSGVFFKALALWLILALNHAGNGSSLKLGLFKSRHGGRKFHGPGLRLGLSKSAHGRKSHGSARTPKSYEGNTHDFKGLPVSHGHNSNRKSPKFSSPNTSTPPVNVSPPNLAPNATSPSRPTGLQVGFYKGQCPKKLVDIEATITTKVQEQFRKDPTILPALLRMQFHDCFVHVSTSIFRTFLSMNNHYLRSYMLSTLTLRVKA